MRRGTITGFLVTHDVRSVVLLAALALGSVALGACRTTGADTERAPLTEPATDAELLWNSILHTYDVRDIEVAVAEEEAAVVVGEWEELNSELRRRFVARGIPAGKTGLVMRVIAEYQRRDRTDEAPRWVPAEDELTAQRARADERDLGGAIQDEFMKRRKQSRR